MVRAIELVGVSDKSRSDAAQQVETCAPESLRNIMGLDELHSSAVVRGGMTGTT